MKTFRYITIALAILLMIGEVYRSWGDGRNIVWVLDDFFVGLLLVSSAILFSKNTPARRAFFAGAWGAGLGMIYPSFFASLLDGAAFNSGNLDWRLLLGLKGFAFLVIIGAFILAIFMPHEDERKRENKGSV